MIELPPRIQEKIMPEPNSGCWIWLGSVGRNGYAKLNTRGKTTSVVHKLLFERQFGLVPNGYELDHTCRVRCCVNPNHLEIVTHKQNMERSAPAQKTHCKYGHLLNIQRKCIACIRRLSRERAFACRAVHLHSKLFCKRGHRLIGNNLYIEHTKKGTTKRRCRTCNRIKDAKRRETRRS